MNLKKKRRSAYTHTRPEETENLFLTRWVGEHGNPLACRNNVFHTLHSSGSQQTSFLIFGGHLSIFKGHSQTRTAVAHSLNIQCNYQTTLLLLILFLSSTNYKLFFYVFLCLEKKCKQDRQPNASFIVTVVYNNVSNCVCVCVCACVCVYVSGGEGGERECACVCMCMRSCER